jgi:glycosyltransferase involved in cell wall biosynthesis
MNVVIVNETLAYPPTSGNRIRTLQLMLRMARHHRITYVCRGGESDDATRRGTEFLRDRGIEAIVAGNAARAVGRAGRCCQLAANVDLWQFEWLPYVEALPASAAGRSLMMAHNVESLIWERYHEVETAAAKRWYVRRQWQKFERYERRIFAAVDHVVTVSRPDALLAQSRFGARRVSVVDNGVDTAYFTAATAGTPRRDPRRLLFLGSLDWRPNLDAVRLLLDQIFPEVVAQEPAARLCLVGRNPPAWVVRRAVDTPGVELHADVPDVRPHLAASGVMVVPLRIGGGSRLKILEAMASGLPVVSTRVGCEGLDVQSGKELIVVDDANGIATGTLSCIRKPASAAAMAARGRRLAADRYDWDVLAEELERIWKQCVAGDGHPARHAIAAAADEGSDPIRDHA